MIRQPIRITQIRKKISAQNHRPIHSHPTSVIKNEELYLRKKNDCIIKNALVINLPESTERLENFQKYNCFNGTTEIIEAIDGLMLPPVPEGVPLRQGSLGCLLSHKKALEYALEQNYPAVLIFEDDAELYPTFNEDLNDAMKELPEGWDMVWLAGNNVAGFPPYPYSEHLLRCNGSWGTYAYVINNYVYQYFIDLFAQEQRSSDDYYRMNHAKFASFKTKKALVKHAGKASDRIEKDRLGKLQEI